MEQLIIIDGKYVEGVVVSTFEGDFGHGWRAGFPVSSGLPHGVPKGSKNIRTRRVGGLVAADFEPYSRSEDVQDAG